MSLENIEFVIVHILLALPGPCAVFASLLWVKPPTSVHCHTEFVCAVSNEVIFKCRKMLTHQSNMTSSRNTNNFVHVRTRMISCTPMSEASTFWHYLTHNWHMILEGHRHNGDQAARRPHVMCSVCGRWFATPRFGWRGVDDGLIRLPARMLLLVDHWHIWSIYLLPF